jgi:hypothetical protein
VTLDADVLALLKRTMHERDVSFKQALNDAVRQGSQPTAARKLPPFVQKTYNMGVPLVDLTKANQLAGELEDQHQIALMQRLAGKPAA